jgi:hypothetical protein
MDEMVEPDRTIVIVSIIGLVVIWGSVLYHKIVQGGQDANEGEASSKQEDLVAATGGDGKERDDKNKSKRPKKKSQKR